MRTLISFATPEYRAQQERQAASAKPYFDEVCPYNPTSLPLIFYRNNAKLFEHRRGFGYWVWKPWLILYHLERMQPGDELMYADSPCHFVADPAPLFQLAAKHDGIGIFHQKRERHKNSKWIKGDTFRLMGCDEPKYWDGDNLLTTYSVWTKTDQSLAFVKEWLAWCQSYEAVSDEQQGPNRPDFKDHRHDQSIASLLAIKHDLFTLCDCSQWGDGYRCPECQYPKIIQTDRGVMAPWLRRPTMSSIIEVSTVGSCALRCQYCPQGELEQAYKGPERLTPEMFRRCLDNLIPGDAIHFSGFTEPCLNPDIVELMEMAIGRSHRCKMYTTGRGLSLGDAARVAALPLDLLMLHLPDAEGHLSHSERNVAVLEMLAKHPNARAMCMGNVPHEAVKAVYEAVPQHPTTMHDRAGNVGDQLVQVEHRRHEGAIRCGVAPQIDHSVLLPSGELALCCMDYGLVHIVGNLATTPYSEILRDGAIQDILDKQKSGGDVLCRGCVCAVPA
jgi:hypothetical protein